MKYIKILLFFLIDIVHNRRLLWDLTRKDFKERYFGSYLGVLWAFIQPTITIMIFWFVFQVGFKSMPVDNFPFILWLITGMLPWFFFSESLNNATKSIIDNRYLVKKVVFRVSLLPVVKIVSSLIVHLFFICIIFGMFFVYGYTPTIYNIQVFYYLFAMIAFVFGVSLITSTLILFFKDVGEIISMFLQFGFWATPVFWSLKIIPESYHFLFKLNPVYYIIEGYRNSFIYHKWFWELGYTGIYFWLITVVVVFIGVYLFKRLRPHFADVL